MQISPIRSAFAASVTNVDLNEDMSPSTRQEMYRSFLEYPILVFRGQTVSPAKHLTFSQLFGDPIIHPLREFHHSEIPEILILSNETIDGKPIGLSDGGSFWHADYSYRQKTASATILNAIRIPQGAGDTFFADMYDAYDSLDNETKLDIAELSAAHWLPNRYTDAAVAFTPPDVTPPPNIDRGRFDKDFIKSNSAVTHPIVRSNPENGRKSLFIHPNSTHSIIGMSEEDSKALLWKLFAHCAEPCFQIRHEWLPGDFVM